MALCLATLGGLGCGDALHYAGDDERVDDPEAGGQTDTDPDGRPGVDPEPLPTPHFRVEDAHSSGGPAMNVRCERLADPRWGQGPACTDSEPSCTAENLHAAPRLGQPQYLLDGQYLDSLDGVHAKPETELWVLIPYEDPDCNLACGTSEEYIWEHEGEGGGWGNLSSETECSSATSGSCFAIPFFLWQTGEYGYEFSVADTCGNQALATGGFTLR